MGRVGLVLLGMVLGVVGLAAARLIVAPPPHTHYHANWAIFVNGERIDLTADRYMEEVSACVPSAAGVLPTQRAHMHNNDHDVVHVHDEGVTWGHLMANLGFGLGEDWLMLGERGTFVTDAERSLKFVVDGNPVLSPYNRLIRSPERLLISYGPESEEEVIETQFPQVASNAEWFNTQPDPAGCAGVEEMTLGGRIRYALFGTHPAH